jgi:hypothetical protein
VNDFGRKMGAEKCFRLGLLEKLELVLGRWFAACLEGGPPCPPGNATMADTVARPPETVISHSRRSTIPRHTTLSASNSALLL